MLSLDTGGKGLVMPQLAMPDFVDSPRGLTPSKELMGGEMQVVEEQEKGKEKELWLVCKMKSN